MKAFLKFICLTTLSILFVFSLCCVLFVVTGDERQAVCIGLFGSILVAALVGALD